MSKSAGRSLNIQLRSSGGVASVDEASGAAAKAHAKVSTAANQLASEAEQLSGRVEGSMLEPSVANKNWVSL